MIINHLRLILMIKTTCTSGRWLTCDRK